MTAQGRNTLREIAIFFKILLREAKTHVFGEGAAFACKSSPLLFLKLIFTHIPVKV